MASLFFVLQMANNKNQLNTKHQGTIFKLLQQGSNDSWSTCPTET